MSKAYSISRFDADGTGETTCVVFARGYEACRTGLSDVGARILYDFPFIGAYGVTVKVHDREDIKGLAEVEAVCGQSKVYACLHRSLPMIGLHGSVGAGGGTGKGVTVAVLDTGTAPHLDLMMPHVRIKAFVDFVGMEEVSYDDNGHGTFVTHTVCGNGLTAGGKFAGAAPSAEVVSLKCMDKNGEAGAFKILQAMQWLYDNHEKYNIKVACMSFGSEPMNGRDPLVIGADALWQKGITVVAAAGNSGPENGSIKSPGISERIITVGGVNIGEDGSITPAPFSSRGPAINGARKPDIVAPAVNITAGSAAGGYTVMSGTSVAAPMVAGLCAVILERRPDWSNNRIKEELLRSAKRIEGGETGCFGHGLVQI